MILSYLTSSIVKAVATERVVARGLGEEVGYKNAVFRNDGSLLSPEWVVVT